MNDQERQILLAARRICSEDGHGIEAVRVTSPREGGGGYAIELSLPPIVSPDDPIVRALVPRLESIAGVERVQVVLAEGQLGVCGSELTDSCAPDQSLRVALERLLIDTAAVDVTPQIELVRELGETHPHTIELVEAARDEDPLSYDYGCFEFAFGLNKHPIGARLRRINYSERRVYVMESFVHWVRKNELIEECPFDAADEGDLVLYFSGERVRHAGLVRGGRVVSKWGLGHLWKHAVWEVPSSYGDRALACVAWEVRQAASAFQRFMEERHRVVWQNSID